MPEGSARTPAVPPAVRRLGGGREQARALAPGTEDRSPTCGRLSPAGLPGGSANAQLRDPVTSLSPRLFISEMELMIPVSWGCRESSVQS